MSELKSLMTIKKNQTSLLFNALCVALDSILFEYKTKEGGSVKDCHITI